MPVLLLNMLKNLRVKNVTKEPHEAQTRVQNETLRDSEQVESF